jgi:NAD(P)-dependent dehydrogenase (short-subunit alcohol dehydrogenase family)
MDGSLSTTAESAAVTVAARSKPRLDRTVAAIEAVGGRALAVAGDVSNRQDVARLADDFAELVRRRK